LIKSMGKRNEEPVSVESLLRFKRHERPDDAFWSDFEADFHKRRLSSLIDHGDSVERRRSFLMKATAFALPIFAVAGLLSSSLLDRVNSAGAPLAYTAPASSGSDAGAPSAAVELPEAVIADASVEWQPSGREQNQFVVDAIAPESTRRSTSFQKVLYSPALQLSVTPGARYIRDSLSTNDYQVTTADLKLGGNF
jgi:hypothetical protein